MGEYEEFPGAWVVMRAWFDGNDPSVEDQEGWLDAVWSPGSVPMELVNTLPRKRYPLRLTSEPLPEHWVYAPSGTPASPGPGTILQ